MNRAFLMFSPAPIHRRLLAVALICCGMLLGGCESGARSLALDKDLARQALQTFLEAWQEGRAPHELQEGSPAIVAADVDWQAGHKLVEWQLAADEKDDGANLHRAVDLTLVDASGRRTKRHVVYVVGTEPVVTVFRQ